VTPPSVARFVRRVVESGMPVQDVLDPCTGFGALLDPWICPTSGFEIQERRVEIAREKGHNVVCCDFMDTEKKLEASLVVCNPPWNRKKRSVHRPFEWFCKILEVFGERQPLVMFVPMGFRLNMTDRNKRWGCRGCEITAIISCPVDMYQCVRVHNEILLFNIQSVKAHYWMERDRFE
jgi:predicted RNA methylase